MPVGRLCEEHQLLRQQQVKSSNACHKPPTEMQIETVNDLNPNGLGSACKILSQFCVPQSSAGHNIQNITTTLPLH